MNIKTYHILSPLRVWDNVCVSPKIFRDLRKLYPTYQKQMQAGIQICTIDYDRKAQMYHERVEIDNTLPQSRKKHKFIKLVEECEQIDTTDEPGESSTKRRLVS